MPWCSCYPDHQVQGALLYLSTFLDHSPGIQSVSRQKLCRSLTEPRYGRPVLTSIITYRHLIRILTDAEGLKAAVVCWWSKVDRRIRGYDGRHRQDEAPHLPRRAAPKLLPQRPFIGQISAGLQKRCRLPHPSTPPVTLSQRHPTNPSRLSAAAGRGAQWSGLWNPPRPWTNSQPRHRRSQTQLPSLFRHPQASCTSCTHSVATLGGGPSKNMRGS